VIALTWIDRLLGRIAETYPRLSPELDVDISGRLLGKLARGSIDLALLPGPVVMRGMVVVDLGSCTLRWMAHPRIAPPGPILTPLDLVNTPIVTLTADSDVHAAMVEWFDHSGTRPRQVSCCTSLSVLISLVQKGVGVSILPEEMLKPAIEAGGLIVIPEQPRLSLAKYSAAYIPRNDLPILPEIAQLARDEATRTTWWHG
jgi:DNA-binding transcriptional LysR family regulator